MRKPALSQERGGRCVWRALRDLAASERTPTGAEVLSQYRIVLKSRPRALADAVASQSVRAPAPAGTVVNGGRDRTTRGAFQTRFRGEHAGSDGDDHGQSYRDFA